VRHGQYNAPRPHLLWDRPRYSRSAA
jgi:hypothetical protein